MSKDERTFSKQKLVKIFMQINDERTETGKTIKREPIIKKKNHHGHFKRDSVGYSLEQH